MKTSTSPRRAAFTLVEILVAVAIVAVLAGILMAVLARANEKGRSAVCQNNLRQIALGMQQYVQDYSGHYPLPSYWQEKLLPYVTDTRLFVCPSLYPNQQPVPLTAPYDYNLHRLLKVAQGKGEGRHEASLPNASLIYLNRDKVLNDGYGVAAGSCNNSTGVSLLHSGGSNFSFLDGHVKWMSPQQYSDIECSLGTADVHAP